MVEHDLAKVGVASSSLVFRSTKRQPNGCLFLLSIREIGAKTSNFVFFGHVNAYFARNSEGVRPVTFLKIRLKWCVYPKPSK